MGRKRGRESLRANLRQRTGSTGRIPQRDGVRRKEFVVTSFTSAGNRLINSYSLPSITQRSGNQGTDIRLADARPRSSDEKPARHLDSAAWWKNLAPRHGNRERMEPHIDADQRRLN